MIAEWGSTADERARPYPCDDVLPEPEQVLFRAASIDAPPSVVFRWCCQLKAAPYSHDRIEGTGGRPGAPPAPNRSAGYLRPGRMIFFGAVVVGVVLGAGAGSVGSPGALS